MKFLGIELYRYRRPVTIGCELYPTSLVRGNDVISLELNATFVLVE